MKSVRRCASVWVVGCLAAFSQPVASADSGNIEDILPLANDPNDPIGLDRDPAFDRAAAARSPSAGSTQLAPEERARFGPTPPPLGAKAGEALTAIANVRERSHRVSLELHAGLALLESELVFESSSDRPAEIEYRLAVPDDAALAGLEVCNPRGCRTGVVPPAGQTAEAYDDAVLARGTTRQAAQLPAAVAFVRPDARGRAVVVRAAAVVSGAPLSVRVRYVAQAPVHGGVARLRLPPRGMDPRAAPLELSLRASDLDGVEAGGRSLRPGAATVSAEPWHPLEVKASLSAAVRSVWQFDCGSRRCGRAYLSAPPRPAAAVDLILAIDASPSTEGAARSRLLPTIAAILARAPRGSRVRALRFASRAEPLVPEPEDALSLELSAFAAVAFEAELGSATRFEAAWELIRSWIGAGRSRARIVIVGDGGLTRGKARPFEAARRAGAEVSVVNVSDRPSVAALAQGAAATGGTVIDAGAEADQAVRGGPPDRLEERVAALFAPVAVARPTVSGSTTQRLPALRAGESASLEGPSRSRWTLRAGRTMRATPAPERFEQALEFRARSRAQDEDASASYLVAVDTRDFGRGAPGPSRGATCDRRGPPLRHAGLSSDAHPVELAAERLACARRQAEPAAPDRDPNEDENEGKGMPSSPLLGMLRQRVVPVARGCFRRDRAGRADYQVRAVFEFELAEREVVSAEVTGRITEELRSCLLNAVDALAVPRFSGRVIVRYPLVTERETLPSQIELTAATAERLDAVIGPE